jgi:hypothetical protein
MEVKGEEEDPNDAASSGLLKFNAQIRRAMFARGCVCALLRQLFSTPLLAARALSIH